MSTALSTDDHDDVVDHYMRIIVVMVITNYFLITIGSIVELLIACFVIYKSCKFGNFKRLPFKVKLTFIVYILMPPLDVYFVYKALVNEKIGVNKSYDYTSTRIEQVIDLCIWIAIHWQFTSYYL